MVVHADEGEKVNTLVNHLLAYLYQKHEWKPREENAFTPALVGFSLAEAVFTMFATTISFVASTLAGAEVFSCIVTLVIGPPWQ